jgi:hypothetical protein
MRKSRGKSWKKRGIEAVLVSSRDGSEVRPIIDVVLPEAGGFQGDR